MESIKYKMDTLINEKIEAEGRVVQLRKEKETFDAEATRFCFWNFKFLLKGAAGNMINS